MPPSLVQPANKFVDASLQLIPPINTITPSVPQAPALSENLAKSDKDDDDDEHQDEQQQANKKHEKQMLKWLGTSRCKLLTENDINAIVEIRQYFDEPIKLLHQHWKIVTMIVLISLYKSKLISRGNRFS